MDDYKKDLIRNNVSLAALVIAAANSIKETSPFPKIKVCFDLKKAGFNSLFNDEFFESTSNMLHRTFDNTTLRKFYAAIEEAYVSGILNFKSIICGDIEACTNAVEEFLKKQDQEDYVDPEISAEVEQMVKDIEEGKDIDDDEDDDFGLDWGDDEEVLEEE